MRATKFRLAFLLLLSFLSQQQIHCEEIHNQEYFILNNQHTNPGFGALFHAVLGALDGFEEGKYAGLKVEFKSGVYFDPAVGSNWWEYFFEPINLGNEQAPLYYSTCEDVCNLVPKGLEICRNRAYELIKKYIHLKPKLQRKVDAFASKRFKNNLIIAVHHRGTDKKLEAPIVPYQTTLFHLNWWVTNQPRKTKIKIYVATDDQEFLDTICSMYPKRVVYNDFVRSKNGEPIHYNDHIYKSNYQKAEEAIIDCLLLARSHILIYPSSSTFSNASLKFNPNTIAVSLH